MLAVQKFRKRPVEIEAIRWDGLTMTADSISQWTDGAARRVTQNHFVVDTPEGQMICDLGDWIIKGVDGEFYPCKPRIFEKTYEPVE